MKKKLLAALLSVSMLASLAGCGADVSWIARKDDNTVNAGVYLYYGLNCYFDAMGRLSEQEGVDNMFTKGVEIDGKDTVTWIKDEALHDVKEMLVINQKFNELGLEISDFDKTAIDNSAKAFYTSNQKMMDDNGISQDSIRQTMVFNHQKNAVFEAYYHKGGIEEVPEAEIIDYMNRNRLRVEWIAIQLKDGEGNLFKSAQKAEAKKMAEEYIQRAKDGEDFESLIKEYDDYYADLVKKATGAKDEEEEDEDKPEKIYESVLVKGGTTPSKKANELMFEKAKIGTPVLVEDNEVYYVVMRYDLSEKEGYLEENRDGMTFLMKSDEFDEKVAEWAKDVDFELNENAYNKYDPKDYNLSALQGQ